MLVSCCDLAIKIRIMEKIINQKKIKIGRSKRYSIKYKKTLRNAFIYPATPDSLSCKLRSKMFFLARKR